MLRDEALKGKGHWLMNEARQDVTEKVIEWLDSLPLKSAYNSLRMLYGVGDGARVVELYEMHTSRLY